MLEIVSKVLVSVALGFIIACLVAIPVYYLWNWLMPLIFGLIKITFWQSMGISILSSLLFRSSNGES